MCSFGNIKIRGLDETGAIVGVTGIVNDCQPDVVDGDQVNVRLECGGNSQVQPAQVFPNGRFYAMFPGIFCRCSEPVTATAECVTDVDCTETVTDDALECGCPEIKIEGLDDSDDAVQLSPEIDCQPDGSANAAFQYTFTNDFPVDVRVEVDCGPDGTVVEGEDTLFAPNETKNVTVVCNFPTPHDPVFTIWLLDEFGAPIGCEPRVMVAKQIKSCCPELEGKLNVATEGCKAIISSDVMLDVGCKISWKFGDNEEDTKTLTVPELLGTEHTYPANDEYDGSVAIQCGKCSNHTGFSVEITECEEEPPDDDDDNGGNGDSGGGIDVGWLLCAFLYLNAWTGVVLAAAMFIAWGCGGFDPGLLTAALVVATESVLALGLWIWVCKGSISCKFLCNTIKAVIILIWVEVALALIFTLFGQTGCAGGVAAAMGHLGVIWTILNELDKSKGCDCPGIFFG